MENKKKILIVEDEESLAGALTLKLDDNFEVLAAKNGEDGLAVALKAHPDLILLDIVMPKMDGIEMLKKLRADEWGKKVEVIVLTILRDNEKVAEVLDNEAFEYLVKTDTKLEDVVTKIKTKLKV